MLLAMAAFVGASTIYQSAFIEPNYVPCAYDGKPGKPSPGNFMGAQITFGGTDRFLASIQVPIGEGKYTPPEVTDTFTATLYLNEGARLTALPAVCSGGTR